MAMCRKKLLCDYCRIVLLEGPTREIINKDMDHDGRPYKYTTDVYEGLSKICYNYRDQDEYYFCSQGCHDQFYERKRKSDETWDKYIKSIKKKNGPLLFRS